MFQDEIFLHLQGAWKEGKEMTILKLNISFILCLGQKNEPRENEKSWKVTKYFKMRILVRNGLMGMRG